MSRSILPHRRLLQISIFDLFLATTAVIALLVSYQASAPRAIVYTSGYIGGLFGTAIAMSRRAPRTWQVLVLGGFVGVCIGWVATMCIGALPVGLPFSRGWQFYWQANPIRRRNVVDITTELSLAGALAASVLYATTAALKTWAYKLTPDLPDNGEVMATQRNDA